MEKSKLFTKTDYINTQDYFQLGLKIALSTPIYSEENGEMQMIGRYVGWSQQQNCLLISNATYKSFPYMPSIAYLKVEMECSITSVVA